MMRIFCIVVLLFLFCFDSFALDWTPYGSLRLKSFYEVDSSDYNKNKEGFDEGSSTELDFQLQSNSRIGANAKHEQLSAKLELGLNPSKSDVSLRHIYLTYDFGNSQLMVGHTSTVLDIGISNQVFGNDNNLNGVGTTKEARKDQVRYSVAGFDILLVEVELAGTLNELPANVETSEDYIIPKIELAYTFKTDSLKVNPFAGIQMTRYKYFQGAENKEKNINAYLVGAAIEWTPASFYLKLNASYAINGGNMGQVDYANSKAAKVVLIDNDLKDTSTVQTALVAGYKISKTYTVEFGAGYRNDQFDSAVKGNGWDKDIQTTMAIYVNTVITLPINFKEALPVSPVAKIVPEIGYLDYGKNPETGNKNGNKLYFGAKWQMDF